MNNDITVHLNNCGMWALNDLREANTITSGDHYEVVFTSSELQVTLNNVEAILEKRPPSGKVMTVAAKDQFTKLEAYQNLRDNLMIATSDEAKFF